MTEKRKSNYELLRIIAIVMITLHHVALNTTILAGNGLNSLIGNIFIIGGKVGVNIFVFITGYFMCEKKVNLKKIFSLSFQVFFYSVFFLLICNFLYQDEVGLLEQLSYFFPIILNKYWFATAFVGLYLISPYLNLLIKKLSEDEYKKMLTMLFIILVVIPTFTTLDIFYSHIGWFIFIYLLAGYIKIFPIEVSSKFSLCSFILAYSLIFSSILTFSFLGNYHQIFEQAKYYFIGQTSILVLISSLSLFLFISNFKMSYSKVINFISKRAFGMYLIQSHPLFNQHIYRFFNELISNQLFWLYIIAYLIVLLIVSIPLDFILSYIFDFVLKIISKCKSLKTNLKGNKV